MSSRYSIPKEPSKRIIARRLERLLIARNKEYGKIKYGPTKSARSLKLKDRYVIAQKNRCMVCLEVMSESVLKYDDKSNISIGVCCKKLECRASNNFDRDALR